MTYTTLMAHTELGHSNANLLRIAGDLATRFNAGVIGIAMCQPMQIIYSEGYIPGDLIQEDVELRKGEIAAAEAEFRDTLQARVKHLEWRSDVTSEPLFRYLAWQARSADLIVTGVDKTRSVFDTSRHLDIGDLVMQAGRPVLVVPAAAEGLKFERILVGWKDTRETRRAVVDALPFLKTASHVTIVEIAAEGDLAAALAGLADVVVWLGRHDVTADPVAALSKGDDTHQLHALALEHHADLIVAGAYGHSRVREWVLGGVTRDLLLHAGRSALVSH